MGVQFEIDANGILHVLARDTRTGQQKIVEMRSAVDVDDSAVQKMVEESVEHAFEDMAARRWVEASLKANEVVAATKKALAECATEIEPGYRGEVEAALRNVQEALGSASSDRQSGDVKRLQAACVALDEITKPMAEWLMDRAMEAVLRKRGLIVENGTK